MNIVLFHYHLKSGGVTSVISHQVSALLEGGHQVLLITGEPPPRTQWPADVIVLPQVAYDHLVPAATTASGAAEAISRAIASKWPRGADLIHVHNPTLAKNRLIQQILKRLQLDGTPLLCQIHDFAEDGRPALFSQEPYLADCHYAVVNSRDRQLLCRAGLRSEGVHLLANAVPFLPKHSGKTPAPETVVYPIRAIRRKNIGEAILLSLFFSQRLPLAITLPPNSAGDIRCYDRWREFVRRLALPVIFDAGLKFNFIDLIAACRFVLSTSITEGFGYAFLEPWTAGKLLWGRRLPDICDDFSSQGIALDHLYSRLEVPLEWFDGRHFKRCWCAGLADAMGRFGRSLSEKAAFRQFEQLTRSATVDFGLLDEDSQRQVILGLVRDRKRSRDMIARHPFLSQPGRVPDQQRLIADNRRAIDKAFNPDRCGRQLMDVYRKVIDKPVVHRIDKQVLIDAFCRPDAFSLLKWGACDG